MRDPRALSERLRASPAGRWALLLVEVAWLLGLCALIAHYWEVPALSFPYWRF